MSTATRNRFLTCTTALALASLPPANAFGDPAAGDGGGGLLAPTPISPAEDAATYGLAPSLFFTEAAGAEIYDVQLSPNADFSTLLHSDTTRIGRFVARRPLPIGELFWRVRSRAPDGRTSGFSEGRRLTVLSPGRVFTIPDGANFTKVQALLGEAAAHTPAVVRFARHGKYRFGADAALINMTAVSDLVIDGNDASIVLTNQRAGLASFNGCRNITLQNLTVDFDPAPFVVGTVVSVAKDGRFSIRLDPGIAHLDRPLSRGGLWSWGVPLDPTVPGRLLTGAPIVNGFQVLTADGDQCTLKLSSPSAVQFLKPGVKWFSRMGGRALVSDNRSTNLACISLKSYASSGLHYVFIYSSDVKVLDCQELIKPGRWYGGNADGVHARENPIGPWIEGNTIEGINDDGVAIYSKGMFILDKTDTSLRLSNNLFHLSPGTRFTIFDPRAGAAIAQDLTVTAVVPRPQGEVGFAPHTLVDFTPPLRAHVVTSNVDPLRNDQVFNRSDTLDSFVVRRNRFHCVRRYGCVIRATHGVIEANEFSAISDVPIMICNEPDKWHNGLNSADVVVASNCIRDSGFSQTAANRGQIHVALYKLGRSYASWRGHRRLKIQSNTIQDWNERGIEVRNATDVCIVENRIDSTTPTFRGSGPHYGIVVGNSEDVTVRANQISDNRPLTEPVRVESSERVEVVAPGRVGRISSNPDE